ncbi:DUF4255 domain-containing protein [Marinigracilibium pacificum]|uniref:DUF4255 domain-containing protein n=1 Tax=Marinigracilibium pacificum TaxID=2729599 RepID=A0A848J2F4_9BACT|nr:DUF4255 domain-containing protein [Marinigracilibium pacificum]NMM49685.1 DUF4255 domain-containing protein [Marinigracilibium pacificum]
MLHTALQFLTTELNDYLKLKTGDPDENRVFITNVATESSGVVIPDMALGMSLINIEEERIFKDQKTTIINNDGQTEHINPEIKLNLYILISANFQDKQQDSAEDDYVEGLKQLSYVISFFQSKNVFTQENSPAMVDRDPNLKKLIVELYSYSFEQLYNFWSVLGTKYLPSVLYKVRLLRFQEQAVQQINLPIEKIRINSSGK